jgi:hypothetical protein
MLNNYSNDNLKDNLKDNLNNADIIHMQNKNKLFNNTNLYTDTNPNFSKEKILDTSTLSNKKVLVSNSILNKFTKLNKNQLDKLLQTMNPQSLPISSKNKTHLENLIYGVSEGLSDNFLPDYIKNFEKTKKYLFFKYTSLICLSIVGSGVLLKYDPGLQILLLAYGSI